MISNPYIVLGLFIIAALFFYAAAYLLNRKSYTKKLNEFNKKHPPRKLTKDEERLLVFGSMLFQYRSEDLLSIIPADDLNKYIYGLKNQWGISNHQEAIEVLNYLLNLEDSKSLNKILQESEQEVTKIKKKILKKLKIDESKFMGVENTYAWDTCRLVALAKWSYWSEYISEEEMWHYIKSAANTASELGVNWEEYMVSFLLGRTLRDFDLDDIIYDCKTLLGVFRKVDSSGLSFISQYKF